MTPDAPTLDESDSDLTSVSEDSSSDEGVMQGEWVKSTINRWNKRPEPHRSDTLKELMKSMQVKDGERMEYVTLFAWASLQKQVKFGDVIRRLVASRCIQEKRGRDHYEKEMRPHYQVCVCVSLCT